MQEWKEGTKVFGLEEPLAVADGRDIGTRMEAV